MDHFEIIERNPKDFGDRLLFYKQGKKICDVDIVVNQEKISAHALVLSTSSEFFENEFILSKSMTKMLTFQDVDTEAFRLLIDYCYTGTIKVLEKNVKEILKIANILLMTPIIERCSSILEKQLNSKNCFSLWKFAKTEHLEDLQLLAFEFCRKNFEEVSCSQEFLNLSLSELSNVLSSDVNVSYEKVLYDAIKRWINHDINTRADKFDSLLNHVRLVYLPQELLLKESQSSCNILNHQSSCHVKFLQALQWQLVKSSRDQLNTFVTIPRDSYITLVTVGADAVAEAGTMNMYDITNENWIQIKDIGCNRHRLSTLLVGDKFMLIGGLENNPVNTINEYDLKSGQMTTLPSMKYPRYVPSVVVFDGFVYVIGGLDKQALSYVEKWNPKTKTWTEVAPMLIPRYGCRARVLDDEIFVLGGVKVGEIYLNETESYNPVSDKWRARAAMNEKRYAPGVAVLGGYLYAICGTSAGNVQTMSAERYDPKIDKWTMIQSTGINRYWMEAGNLMGKLVVLGGFTNGASMTKLATVQVYDEENDKWKPMPSLKSVSAMSRVIEIPWGLAKLLLPRKAT